MRTCGFILEFRWKAPGDGLWRRAERRVTPSPVWPGKRRDSVNSGRAAARTLAKAPGVVNARGGADSPFFLKDLAPNLRSNERLDPANFAGRAAKTLRPADIRDCRGC